jgi:large subunit ribosomal protein L9
MKIILLKDVVKVGKKYEVKDVAEGFALNMLIPRGLAQVATAGEMKKIEGLKSKELAEKQIQGELLSKSLDTIKGLKLNLKEKANEKGHLFAGVTKEMLVVEIQKAVRLNIDPESIKLSKPLKELGEHKVTVEAMDKKAEFVVNIEAE